MISVAYTNTSAAPGIWNVSAIASNANGTAMQTWWWTVLANTTAAEQLYVNESGWWRDGGAFNANDTPIQAAIDAADSGNSIFVYNGTYYEGGGVSITKERLTLQGEDANTTIIHGRWTAEKVVYVTGDYVNVSGFTVTGSTSRGYGIYVNADYCTISDNNASESRCGIYLRYSSNCTLENNIASSNYYGIHLRSTSINNNIKENTVSDNTDYGMYLEYSSDNEIYHNNFINNNKQAYDHHGFNSWDKGASVGGNYWSDHACHGNPSDGTEPYNGIDTNAGAEDAYPFEEPDGWATAPSLFTTADAVIALQIAVGSHEYDPELDMNGDGRVSSLDALMILQVSGR